MTITTIHEGGTRDGPGADDPNLPDVPMGITESSDPLSDIKSGLKIQAEASLSLGKSLDRHSDMLRRYLDRLERNTPVDYGAVASGPFPATGFLVLNFGTPDQGTRWEVTNVVLTGLDETTPATGTAGLYVSGLVPNAGQAAAGINPAGGSAMADNATSLPNPAFYGTRQLIVNDQEYLFAIIFGGTVGQTYIGNMSATVFNVAAAGGQDVNIL